MSDLDARFLHRCEVCNVEVLQTPDEAFDAGWDYPPNVGTFGVLSPRTCGDCPMDKTAWWAIAVQHRKTAEELGPQHLATIERVRGELD